MPRRPLVIPVVVLAFLAVACGGGGPRGGGHRGGGGGGGGTDVQVDGTSTWPPSGPGCEAYIACCNDAKSLDSSVDLMCQLTIAGSPNCDAAKATVKEYVTELGKTAPSSCQ
jgi:hypothetical protein